MASPSRRFQCGGNPRARNCRCHRSKIEKRAGNSKADDTTAKTNYDAAGNATDRCYWEAGITVGDCLAEGTGSWPNPPTQVTTTVSDARNSRIELRDSESGTTTTYDPAHNYQIWKLYVPTDASEDYELQSTYQYDARHRVTSIVHVQCEISSGHNCSTTTPAGSSSYAYDGNDNRMDVGENNGSTGTSAYYCYDALNRLQYRKTGAGCTGTTTEEYVYDAAGNRTKTVLGGTSTFYNHSPAGLLCEDWTSQRACPGDPSTWEIRYDSDGRTTAYNGWIYEYDAEGRLIRACESTSCTGSIDKVEFSYDGEGHRTQVIETEAGGDVTTRDFRYQGDAIVQESETIDSVTTTREYVVDDTGGVVRFCDPFCADPDADIYLVTWNGHGDALGVWRVDDGELTLANSYTYSSWGAPTTATHNSIGDLGFRFLYVGHHGVQWDSFSGLGAFYMRARHYVPAIGRFLQPDPANAGTSPYAYANGSPVTWIDPLGRVATVGDPGGSASECTRTRGCLAEHRRLRISASDAVAWTLMKGVVAAAAAAITVPLGPGQAGAVAFATTVLVEYVPGLDIKEGDVYDFKAYYGYRAWTYVIKHERSGQYLETFEVFWPRCGNHTRRDLRLIKRGEDRPTRGDCPLPYLVWYK